jgi:hypothetical protein
MMRTRRFSRAQRLILVFMAVALIAVLVALGNTLRRATLDSPLSTAALPVTRHTPTASFSPTPKPSPNATTDAAVAASPGVASSQVAIARRVEQLGREIGTIRELPKQQEVPLSFLDADAVASYLRQLRDEPGRRDDVARQQELLAALDLLPEPDEGVRSTVHARARRIVAFYDGLEDQIFLGPMGVEGDGPDFSLVHQYVHALVDQHFDLLALAAGAPSGDAARARDALVEGDATAVLAMWRYGGLDQVDLDKLSEHLVDAEVTDYEGFPTSRAMANLFLFPYRDGALFVSALLQTGWWPAVNSAYLDPPVSTEQILHPEKYIDTPRDLPLTVALPDLSEELEDWRRVGEGVLGELVLRAHLDHYLPDTDEANAAAAGWDGDLASVWQDPDQRRVLVMRIAWDGPGEAAEFKQSYITLIDRRLQGASAVLRPVVPPGGRWWRGEGGDAFLLQEQDTVLAIWAPDSETMERILTVLFVDEE